MQILTNSDGLRGGGEATNNTVTAMVEAGLGRFSTHVTRVEVHMTDQNGGKGGKDDKRCVLEAHLEGRKPVAVVENAANMKQAVQGAIDKLVRMLDSTVGKMNEHRRNLPAAPVAEDDPA
jgi:ribosome-associated translation inhibitor RaiA